MIISTLKAHRNDSKLPTRHPPAPSMTSDSNPRMPNPDARSISGYLPEGAERTSYGGAAQTVLSSIHVYT